MIAFGADIGWRRVSLAGVKVEGGAGSFEVASYTMPDNFTEAELLNGLYAGTLGLIKTLTAELGQPLAAAVELPSGKYVMKELHYSYCAVSLALIHAGTPPVGIPPATWKSTAMGKGFGSADKATIKAWARQFGYDGASQDEADAIGIALARCRLAAEPDVEQLMLG